MLNMLSGTAGSIASERRRGSLDLLLASPLRSEEITAGSLCGVFLTTSPLLVLGVFEGVVATGLGQFNLGGVVLMTSAQAHNYDIIHGAQEERLETDDKR